MGGGREQSRVIQLSGKIYVAFGCICTVCEDGDRSRDNEKDRMK